MNLIDYTKSFSSNREKKGYLTKSARNALREYIAEKRKLGWSDDKMYADMIRQLKYSTKLTTAFVGASGGITGYLWNPAYKYKAPSKMDALIGTIVGALVGYGAGKLDEITFKRAWKYVHDHPEYE